MEKIKNVIVYTIGSDPEFFFEKDGQIIGSEKVIDKPIIVNNVYNQANFETTIIRDGIQGEFNLSWQTCRAHLGETIKRAFTDLEKLTREKGVEINLQPVKYMTKSEMLSLSDDSKKFGCSPSKNIWDMPPEIPIETIDPEEYLLRSAGGHIHIGGYNNRYKDQVLSNVEKEIKMLDILLGNTCVLLDRSDQAARRKTYGRAGEYRIQPWGIEYRVLSNFWLHSYQLMSFVFGAAREAIIIANSIYYDEFKNAVEEKDIIKAINENDFDLAMSNFEKLIPIINKSIDDNFDLSIKRSTIETIKYVAAEGIYNVFNFDPILQWKAYTDGHYTGWESFSKFYQEKQLNKFMEKIKEEIDLYEKKQ